MREMTPFSHSLTNKAEEVSASQRGCGLGSPSGGSREVNLTQTAHASGAFNSHPQRAFCPSADICFNKFETQRQVSARLHSRPPISLQLKVSASASLLSPEYTWRFPVSKSSLAHSQNAPLHYHLFPNTVSVPFLLEAIPYHPVERPRFLLRILRPCTCHSSHTGHLLLRVRVISLHVHASQLLTPDYKRSFLIKYPDMPNKRPCSHCLFSLSKCPESLFQPDHPQFLLHCFWNLPGITKWSNETHLLTTHVLWPICNPCLKPKSNPKLIFLILDTSGRLESAFLYSKH